ncbi:hypothetical protein ACQ86N_42160 [Puia sp. P3]|uniref:hypothetical protein n=1 Tax=Puia sp. P3 TaxID=3423952 RepID=UPI003D669CAE
MTHSARPSGVVSEPFGDRHHRYACVGKRSVLTARNIGIAHGEDGRRMQGDDQFVVDGIVQPDLFYSAGLYPLAHLRRGDILQTAEADDPVCDTREIGEAYMRRREDDQTFYRDPDHGHTRFLRGRRDAFGQQKIAQGIALTRDMVDQC